MSGAEAFRERGIARVPAAADKSARAQLRATDRFLPLDGPGPLIPPFFRYSKAVHNEERERRARCWLKSSESPLVFLAEDCFMVDGFPDEFETLADACVFAGQTDGADDFCWAVMVHPDISEEAVWEAITDIGCPDRVVQIVQDQ
jgi:hypothetical protein